MKLSKLFHSLYAILMFLPVMVIPIFAININQKSVEPIQVEVQEKISVDFNQYSQYLQYSNTNTDTPTEIGNRGRLSYMNNNTYRAWITEFDSTNAPKLLEYYFTLPQTIPSNVNNIGIWYSGSKNNLYFCNFYFDLQPYHIIYIKFNLIGVNPSVVGGISFENVQAYDLTQMYGSGNEPTKEEFNAQFTSVYDYTTSKKMLVNKPTTTIYNDTDIGSQFLYSLYIQVKEYFNFGNFFGLGGMYDWFALNIFNGTAPLSFFIVFNLLIYWIFISLFWLIFDILIYVPMVIHKWLDKAEM